MKYPKGHEFEYRMLRPSQIRVDSLYQRQLDAKRVDKIVREFNGDTFNEPKVSYRDGLFFVFDGQHSIAAWRRYHENEDTPLLCKVYKGMTWLEECDAFVRQNGLDKDPTTNDKLRAAYNSKNPDVVDMVQKAEMCGFVVDFVVSKTPSRIVATTALYRAYKMLGGEKYLRMLTAIKEAWYGDMDAISSQIITGMATVFKTYHFDMDSFVKSMKRTTPTKIIAQGKTYRDRTNTYSREIVKQYNYKRTKYKLDEAEL